MNHTHEMNEYDNLEKIQHHTIIFFQPQNLKPIHQLKLPDIQFRIIMFSKFLNVIRENLTSNDIIQHVKHDLQKIIAWFIIGLFVYNIDFIPLARKNFRPQNTDNETILAEQTDYV